MLRGVLGSFYELIRWPSPASKFDFLTQTCCTLICITVHCPNYASTCLASTVLPGNKKQGRCELLRQHRRLRSCRANSLRLYSTRSSSANAPAPSPHTGPPSNVVVLVDVPGVPLFFLLFPPPPLSSAFRTESARALCGRHPRPDTGPVLADFLSPPWSPIHRSSSRSPSGHRRSQI